jgi:hypothetical protein
VRNNPLCVLTTCSRGDITESVMSCRESGTLDTRIQTYIWLHLSP